MARTACLVCFSSSVNGRSNKKKKRKEEAYPWKASTSSRHITNLKQSILETFDIYGPESTCKYYTSLKNLSVRNTLAYWDFCIAFRHRY